MNMENNLGKMVIFVLSNYKYILKDEIENSGTNSLFEGIIIVMISYSYL